MAHLRLFGHYVHTPYLVMSACEAIIVASAAYIGYFFQYQQWPPFWGQLVPAVNFGVIVIAFMYSMGVYESRIREGYSAMMLRTAVAVFLLGTSVSAVLSFGLPNFFLDRGALVVSAGTAFLLVGVARWIAFSTVDLDSLRKRVLVLGTSSRALKIATRMRRKSDQQNFKLLGFLPIGPDEPNLVGAAGAFVIFSNLPLVEFCRENAVDEIVVAADDPRGMSQGPELPMDDLIQCRIAGIDVCDVQQFIEREAFKIDVDLLRPSWLAFTDGFEMRNRHRFVKRFFDVAASLMILLIMWPVMLIVAAAIRCDSRGPVIFRQDRVGRDGIVFELMKFRSMKVTESNAGPDWTRQNDPRVTRVGRYIRQTRLDELPQLFNVLRGDMSFVGPRPERPVFVTKLNERIPYYAQRHRVKPGITGWAQLRYAYGASVDDAKEKLQYDLYYLKNNSLLLDMIILLQTVEVVLIGKGAR
jgi:sugar transferase (PEP-CTERM system associated)